MEGEFGAKTKLEKMKKRAFPIRNSRLPFVEGMPIRPAPSIPDLPSPAMLSPIPAYLCCFLLLAPALPLAAQEPSPADDPPLFRAQILDGQLEGAKRLAVADVDGDGKADVLLASKRELAWYRAPDWKKFVAACDLAAGPLSSLAARDIDGDGRCEVAVGSDGAIPSASDPSAAGAVCLLLPGQDPTRPWQVMALPHDAPVSHLQWARLPVKAGWSLLAQCLPKGPDEPSSLVAFHVPAEFARPDLWRAEPLPPALHQPGGFDVRPGSAEQDSVVISGQEGLMLREGNTPFHLELDASTFEEHPGTGPVRFGPGFTQRGRSLTFYTAIEPSLGRELVVYRAINGRSGAEGFERTVVEDRLSQGQALVCADLLGLGREQIVAAWGGEKPVIKLYVCEFGDWLSTPVDEGGLDAADLQTADLNQDGKLDLVAAGHTTHNLAIYWNEASIQSPSAPETNWKKHVLWQGGPCPSAVAADFTGDGAPDVGFTSGGKAHLLTAPDWTHRVLSPAEGKNGGVHCAAMDADGDGDLDFIDSPQELRWLENPGKDSALSSQPWISRLIDRDPDGIHCVLPADVNQDGKLDLLANQFNPVGPLADSIMWYEAPPSPGAAWIRHVLAAGDAPGGSHYLGWGDLNGDGFPDLTAAAKGLPFENGNWLAWWKNPGATGREQSWAKSTVALEQWGATHLLPGDVDRDGDNDLLASRGHGVGLAWFDNLHGDGSAWELVEIDPLIAAPHCLVAADLDGDGDLDAATCGYEDRIVSWYENEGQGEFLLHDLDHGQEGYDLRAADLDGDGDLDLLLAGRDSANVVYYENPARSPGGPKGS